MSVLKKKIGSAALKNAYSLDKFEQLVKNGELTTLAILGYIRLLRQRNNRVLFLVKNGCEE